MPAPAAAPVAAKLLAGAAAGRARRGSSDGGSGGWLMLVLVLFPVGLVVGLVLLLSVLGGAAVVAQQQACASGGPLPGDFTGPGSLGGVGGTGISKALVRRVQTGSPYAGNRITPGRYNTTAYGPPWGGINGPGIATSGGLPIAGGSPRWYMIAVDPDAIAHGTFVYVWPNPFGWKGPFFAADTGGAIVGNRIDFYDWRSRASQLRWGTRSAKASARPNAPGAAGPRGAGPGGGAPPRPGAPPPAAAETGPVLNLGDSLAVGSGPALERELAGRTVTTLARNGRTSSEGLSALRGAGKLPKTIIVQLGTNDTDVASFRANVRSIVAIARRSSATVWWPNISRPPLGGTTAAELNAVLDAEAKRSENLRVIDWKGAVDAGRADLGADQIHPPAPARYGQRADLIAEALGGGPATPVGPCAPPGSLGELTGTPEQIVNRVVAYAHENGFPHVTAETVRSANAAHGPTVSGGTSDHQGPPDQAWAADFSNSGSPTPEMDALAKTIAAGFGVPWQGSGLVTAGNDEYRLQLIYRTCDGGDHWNHVHFGVRRGAGQQPATTALSTPRPC
jgi:3D (Asp-Asp-Asp) domain-containing protein